MKATTASAISSSRQPEDRVRDVRLTEKAATNQTNPSVSQRYWMTVFEIWNQSITVSVWKSVASCYLMRRLFFGQQQVEGEAAEYQQRSEADHERSGDLSDVGKGSKDSTKPGSYLIVLPCSKRNYSHEQDQESNALGNGDRPRHAFKG